MNSRIKNAPPDRIWTEGLNDRQVLFVQHYMHIDTLGDAQAAARAAGYGFEAGKQINAHQVLNKPLVQKAIATLRSERIAQLDCDAIKQALARLTLADMANFVSVEEVEVPLTDEEKAAGKMPRMVSVPYLDWAKARDAAAIGQIKEFKIGKDGEIHIKIHDPRPALETLSKIAGLLQDRVDLTSGGKPIAVKIISGVKMEDL